MSVSRGLSKGNRHRIMKKDTKIESGSESETGSPFPQTFVCGETDPIPLGSGEYPSRTSRETMFRGLCRVRTEGH